MKQNHENNEKQNKLTQQYEDSINKLQNAQSAKDNGNIDKMKKELDNVNSKLDDLKNKLSEWFNNSK